MIKNLIFDFGKVLVDYEYFETLDQIFKTHEQAEEFRQISMLPGYAAIYNRSSGIFA